MASRTSALSFTPIERPKEVILNSNLDEEIQKLADDDLLSLYFVNLAVISASDIKNVDGIFDKSDPYCEVHVGGISDETDAVDNDLNPIWNKKMQFFLSTKPKKMELKVIDKNNVAKDVFIGRANFSFKKMFEGNADLDKVEMPLYEQDGKTKSGTITFQIKCRTLKPAETEIRLAHVEKKLSLKVVHNGEIVKAFNHSEQLRKDAIDHLSSKEQEIITISQVLTDHQTNSKVELTNKEKKVMVQAAVIEAKLKELIDITSKLEEAESKKADAEKKFKKTLEKISERDEELKTQKKVNLEALLSAQKDLSDASAKEAEMHEQHKKTQTKLTEATALKTNVDDELIKKDSIINQLEQRIETMQKELGKTKNDLDLAITENAQKKSCLGIFG